MHKKLLIYAIIGILFTSLLGTLSHFVYEWSGQNFLAGLFTPVSESTWEHMKLLFFPMVLYGLAIPYLERDFPCISYAYPLGILAGVFAIPVIFYTYSGILGRNYTVMDILTFYISVIFAFVAVYFIASQCKGRKNPLLPWFLVIILSVCFMVFTIFPPSLGIFKSY